MLMFESVLKIALSDLVDMMEDEDLECEMEEGVERTCAFPVYVSERAYDADDMTPEARISRWVYENCGINEITIYVEVEA